MTTLPQTAAVRLPRPMGSSALAVAPQVPHGGLPGAAGPVVGMTGADVWRVIRSNLWLILLMLIVSSIAGYAMNRWLEKYHPKYTAEGKVEVLGMMDTLDDGTLHQSNDPMQLPLEVHKHATMLKDATLFTKILQNPNDDVRTTAWYKRWASPAEAKQDLVDHLDIAYAPDSKLIAVSMTDSDPVSCQIIVESVVDQYIKAQMDANRDMQSNAHEGLQLQETTEEGKLRLLNGDINDAETELATDGVTGTANKINAKEMELTRLYERDADLKLDAEAAEEQRQTLEQQLETGQPLAVVEQFVDDDHNVQNDRQAVNTYEISLANALNGDMGPESRQLQGIEKYKALLEKKLDQDTQTARERYKTQYVENVRQRASMAKAQYGVVEAEINQLKQTMTQLSSRLESLLEKQNEKNDIEAKLKDINNKIDQMNSYNSKHEYAGVEWAARPEVPDVPSFPKLAVTMTSAILMGLLLSLGIAFLRELMDTSIRSPRDINRVGNMTLLGMVPHEDDDPQSAGARLPLVIFEAPHSMMAEQLRQVRTRLQHSSSLDTTRSILVTSPSPGDGKSTIACNLAAGLALNGRRILLVDANFRRPELHRVFNLGNEQGFSDVLNSLDLFEHAVQETQVPNLFILPSGPKPTNATELVESQLLVDFIERTLEEFDHVIFDSGPLLFVSETVGLAPRVDGVVTVVRARINTRGVLSRMRDTLRQVKAEHLGVVLNGVRAQGGGYYGRNIRTYYEYQNGNGRAA